MRNILFILLAASVGVAMADASLPTADIKGSHDVSFLGRYEGSRIVAYKKSAYDRFVLPLSPLKAKPDKRDNHNNILFEPEKNQSLEGKLTRLVYLLPAERTPLEVLRNYEDEISSKGGKLLFTCEKSGCGGDPRRGSSGGGGDMSLAMFLQSEENVNAYNKPFSNGHCALTSRIVDQYYLSAEIPENNAFVSVLAYTLSVSTFCKAFDKRTIAVVDVLQLNQREQKMVVVKADEMTRAIDAEGKIALYGIYFDTDKAEILDESRPSLDEIAKMLQQRVKMKILVVGHTDNVGAFDYNMGLSKRRAEAVVAALSGKYGIAKSRLKAVGVSFAAPVSSNRTEEGRAKNRRVVLVEQ